MTDLRYTVTIRYAPGMGHARTLHHWTPSALCAWTPKWLSQYYCTVEVMPE